MEEIKKITDAYIDDIQLLIDGDEERQIYFVEYLGEALLDLLPDD